MKRYYVYFDDYRRPRKAITEEELLRSYGNDPAVFQKAMSEKGAEARVGQVGVLSFESERELRAYLEEGEEIAGFYECRADSRPYNF